MLPFMADGDKNSALNTLIIVLGVLGGVALGALILRWAYQMSQGVAVAPMKGAGQQVAGPIAYHVQEARRYLAAAQGSPSPTIGLTHASYALTHLNALEHLGAGIPRLKDQALTLQDRFADALTLQDPTLGQMMTPGTSPRMN